MKTMAHSHTRTGRPARLLGLVLLGAALFQMSACETLKRSNRQDITFDGVAFRSKSDARDKQNKKLFEVTVQPVSASFEGAREAGRWEATRYCIRNYGSSSIKWDIGPDAEATSLPVTDDKLTLLGRCDP